MGSRAFAASLLLLVGCGGGGSGSGGPPGTSNPPLTAALHGRVIAPQLNPTATAAGQTLTVAKLRRTTGRGTFDDVADFVRSVEVRADGGFETGALDPYSVYVLETQLHDPLSGQSFGLGALVEVQTGELRKDITGASFLALQAVRDEIGAGQLTAENIQAATISKYEQPAAETAPAVDFTDQEQVAAAATTTVVVANRRDLLPFDGTQTYAVTAVTGLGPESADYLFQITDLGSRASRPTDVELLLSSSDGRFSDAVVEVLSLSANRIVGRATDGDGHVLVVTIDLMDGGDRLEVGFEQGGQTVRGSASLTARGGGLQVLVTPREAGVDPGGRTQFAALVVGGNDRRVQWTAGLGQITGEGKYTAPMSVGEDTVTATSVADPSRSSTARVLVSNTGQLGVTVH